MSDNTAKQPGRKQTIQVFFKEQLKVVSIITVILISKCGCGSNDMICSPCLWWSSVDQVYTGSWGDHDGIIRCKLGEVVRYEFGEEPEPRRETSVFDKPTRGTSVEKFREMVFNHLKVKDNGHKLNLVKSLTEAWNDHRSVWCLSPSLSLSSESRQTSPASSARSCLSLMATEMDRCHCQKPALHGPSCRWTRWMRK